MVRGWTTPLTVKLESPQPIPQRAGAGVVHVEVELRDVIDQAPAAAGDVGGGAVGPEKAGSNWARASATKAVKAQATIAARRRSGMRKGMRSTSSPRESIVE
jgi:hypothetical protein